MKLLILSAGLTLLNIVPVLCWPANENVFRPYPDTKPSAQQEPTLPEDAAEELRQLFAEKDDGEYAAVSGISSHICCALQTICVTKRIYILM